MRLKRSFGPGARSVPVRLTLAAELLSGLEREWPGLRDPERAAIRGHVRDAADRLHGIAVGDAREIQQAARIDDQPARMFADLNRQMKALGDTMVTQSLLEAIGRASR